jgi:type I restriction enzyme M protein
MARKASSKPESSNSTATLGFDTDSHSFGNRHSVFVISSAWVQHFIHHLANGSMSSNQSGERDLRRALPGQLFYSTQIPVCLWFIARDKSGGQPSPWPSPTGRGRSAAEGEGRLRDRRRATLFIDARKMGTLIDRVHRELTAADLEKIVSTCHAWHGDSSHVVHASACSSPPADTLKREQRAYQDLPGFCKSATTAKIAAHGHVLTPGRYVGAEGIEDDGDPFEEKMPRLVAELHAQFAESAKLEQAIKANLRGLGYGG